MNCPFCNKDIPDNAKFCQKCGHQIVRCPSCNDVIRKKVKFCPKDGAPLPQALIVDLPDAPLTPPGNGGGSQAPRICIKCGKQHYGNGPKCNKCMQSGGKNPIIIVLLVVLMIALLGVVGVLAFGVFNGDKDYSSTTATTAAASTATLAQTQPTTESEDTDDDIISDQQTATNTPLSIAEQYNYEAVESPYDGHAYAIFNYKDLGLTSFNGCEKYCEQMGGHLAVINSQEENDFLYQYVRESGLNIAFFGYTDQSSEGNWKWVDGSNSGYTNWCKVRGKEQPNNGSANSTPEPENYAEFYKETLDGTWNDSRFGVNTWRFICEWE